jgi:hypothetical protein
VRGGGKRAVSEHLEFGTRPEAGEALGWERSDVDDDGMGAELGTDLGDGVLGGISDERDEVHGRGR